MSTLSAAEQAAHRARQLLAEYPWREGSAIAAESLSLLDTLRRLRQFSLLAQLADRIARRHPLDPFVRRLQVQALIETGQASAAVDVAQSAIRRLDATHVEWAELNGLLGRAYKQMFIDARRLPDRADLASLKCAISAYRKPFDANPANSWHAINLVAVAACAERLQLKRAPRLDYRAVARQIIETIGEKPTMDRWDSATLAEACLALGQIDAVEAHLGSYLSDDNISAFEVGSTLRQLEQVWDLGNDGDRGRGILNALRARLLQLPGAHLEFSAEDLITAQQAPMPSAVQLEAIFGPDGSESFKWWQTGLQRASSVASICAGIGSRVGTGFLVSASDFGLGDTPGALVLTNFHVVNAQGSAGALRAEDANVVFEAFAPDKAYGVSRVVWSSPVDRHDATLLLLDEVPDGLVPMELAKRLPVRPEDGRTKVYVIGHSGGGGLEFSFQDNELLDHEGPGDSHFSGDPCRLHYRAPTEKGNSGSPVFNSKQWQVIGLHHAGGILSRLNGKCDTYQANEGIALLSIIKAVIAA